MCSKTIPVAAALAGALLLPAAALAQAVGPFGGGHSGAPPPSPRPGIGVGSYAPGQGPVGAAGWNGGSWHGYTKPYGLLWGGGSYGGGGAASPGGGPVSSESFTYNHFDNRRRDGGFYGGAGVFYGDDGYSRLPPSRTPDDAEASRSQKRADEAFGVERPTPNIILLHNDNGPASARPRRAPGKKERGK